MENDPERTGTDAADLSGTGAPGLAKDIEDEPSRKAVNVEDFTGVGRSGGITAGLQSGAAQNVAERVVDPADPGTYDMSAVEEQPSLTNAAEIARNISRNYPPLLRDAGVTGTVLLRFRIQADGRVDPLSITVENSSHEGFNDPAKRVSERMRFRPAMVAGEFVASWTGMPITFQIRGNG